MSRLFSPIGLQLLATLAFAAIVTGAFQAAPALDRQHCITVSLASSQEKSAMLTDFADAYNAAKRSVDGYCVRIDPYQMNSGDAEAAIAAGWPADRRPTHQPQPPDVWSPASSAWVGLLRLDGRSSSDARAIAARAGSDSSPLFESPLVIGMPQPMANALGYPAAPIGWSDVFRLATNPAGWASVAGGTASWGAFKLAKTLPTVSTSGLNALIATYYASGVPMTGNGVEQSPVARRFVGAIELSVVHYGLTVREFTVNLQRVDETGSPTSYVSAIALEEQELVQYDHSARTPLVPVYPNDGTLVEDHPFVVLATSRPKIDGAHDFYRWVEQTQQAAIDQNGFRLAGIAGHKTPLQGGVLEANLKLDGVNPARSFPSIAAPPGDVIRAMVHEWAQLRRPARVQILIDTATSASLESTLCRIQKALAALQPQDQVAIATFPATDGSGYLQVLPIATVGTAPAIGKPPCGPAPPALVQALAMVKPAPDATGSTLDAALGEAVSMLNSSYEPQSINAVLLVELASPNLAPSALNALAQKLIDQSAPTAHDGQGGVRVFAIGPTADASLARITTSGQGAIYPSDAPPSLLNGVISGF